MTPNQTTRCNGKKAAMHSAEKQPNDYLNLFNYFLKIAMLVAAFGCFWLLVAAFTGHREHQ
jgi:hypothetical protein